MRKQNVIFAVALLFVLKQTALGTLIIGLFNVNSLYLASDSLAVASDSNNVPKYSETCQKLFKVTDGVYASMSGVLAWQPEEARVSFISILTNQIGLNKLVSPTINQISNIVCGFNDAYQIAVASMPLDANVDQGTTITFWGYDKFNGFLFFKNFLFAPRIRTSTTANAYTMVPYDPNNKCQHRFEGEVQFPELLIANNVKITNIVSPDFINLLNEFTNGAVLKNDQAKTFMTDIFKLSKKWTTTYTSDKGLVGEPWVIYKITTNGTVRLN